MKKLAAVVAVLIVATIVLAQVLGPGEFSTLLVQGTTTLGTGAAADVTTTYDLDTDQSLIWDESDDALEWSHNLSVGGDTSVLGGDITYGDNTDVSRVTTWDNSTLDGTLTYGASGGLTYSVGNSVTFSAGTPTLIFLDTDDAGSVAAGSFQANYSSNLGSGNDGGGFVVNAQFNGGVSKLSELTWSNPASGVKKHKYTRTYGGGFGSTNDDVITYTGTTDNDGHWKHSTAALCYEWDKHPYFSEDGGGVLMVSGATCYDCDIDTTTLMSFSEKSWAFSSPNPPGTGTFYVGGFYDFAASDNDFNPTINWGTANASYAAHFFVVCAAGGAGGTDTTITITGTSINDSAVRDAGPDTATIVMDDAGAAGAYYETSEKWIGQVAVVVTAGPDLLCNYGWAKYWDNSNTSFDVVGLEATWLGGANDATPDIALLHHKATGWTYNNGSTPTPPTALARLTTDHVTEFQVKTDENGAWKRTNLSTTVDGSASEGTIVAVTTSTARAFELGTFLLRIQADVSHQSNWACTATACP